MIVFPETNKKISKDAIAGLQQIAIENDSNDSKVWTTQLPRLSNQAYKEADNILRAMRGQYITGKQKHWFPYNPTDAIAKVVETGKMPLANPGAFFPTPPDIIQWLLAEADYPKDTEPGFWKECRALEPSAGDGAIIKAIRQRDRGLPIDAVELDPINIEAMRQQEFEGVNLIEGDFLEIELEPRYIAIVTNPPFSTKGNKNLWVKHIEKCLTLLRPGGKLAFIAPDNFRWSDDPNIAALRHEMALRNAYVKQSPCGAFRESGTEIATVLVSCYHFGQDEMEKRSRPYNGLDSWWQWNLGRTITSEHDFYDKFMELAKLGVDSPTEAKIALANGQRYVKLWLRKYNKECDDGYLLGLPDEDLEKFVKKYLTDYAEDYELGKPCFPHKPKQLELL